LEDSAAAAVVLAAAAPEEVGNISALSSQPTAYPEKQVAMGHKLKADNCFAKENQTV
jgi:putative aminopeptidase FrvX